MDHCVHLLKTQGYAVIVVAEGCGDTLIEGDGSVDGGGNKKLADVGIFLRDALLAHFKSVKMPLTVKYIDPTYTIRAIPANANDSVYCTVLAQQSVHGAMAGYTGITVAKVNERFVYLPISLITDVPNRKVDIQGDMFQKLIATTNQPNLGMFGEDTAAPIDP